MLQSKNILSLTTDLLASGAFSHLTDEQVSSLHHLILQLQEPLTIIQQRLLLSYWSQIDATELPPPLLHRCNMLLQQYGCAPAGACFMAVEQY